MIDKVGIVARLEARISRYEALSAGPASERTAHAEHKRSRILPNMKVALSRAREGLYGVCIDCEAPIGDKRLAAVLGAIRCASCQSVSESARRESRQHR